MPLGYIPPRLVRLVEAGNVDDLDEAHLERLIGLDEAADLDFKQGHYGNSDADRKELAYDIADRANDVGGLIFIGIEEEAGRATALVPLPPDPYGEEETLRINKVITSRIFPYPEVHVRRIDSTSQPDKAFYVISISPSDWAPHAVSVGGEALRWPRRSGTGRRWLSESEIADAYRNRHRQQGKQISRLEQIHEDMVGTLDTTDFAWVVVSLVPNRPGRLEISRQTLETYREWVNKQGNLDCPAQSRTAAVQYVQADYRSVRFSDAPQLGDPPYALRGRMYDDGAGSLATKYDEGVRTLRLDAEGTGYIHIGDEELGANVINSLRLLGAHAVEWALTGGDSAVLIQVIGCGRMESVLFQYRTRIPEMLRGSTPVAGPTPLSRHMVRLEEIAVPGPLLILAARPLIVDLVSCFGIPAPDQIMEDGLLDLQFFYRRGEALKRWIEQFKIPNRP